MAASAVVSDAGPRVRAQGVVWLAVGLALTIGGGGAIYLSRDNPELRAFRAALPCASLDDALAGKNCRYTSTATVTEIVGEGGATSISINIQGMYLDASVPGSTDPDPSIAVGSEVKVELWGARVTRIANLTTYDNPANDSRAGTYVEIGLLLLLLGAGALLMARRLWREDRDRLSMDAALTPVAASDLLTH